MQDKIRIYGKKNIKSIPGDKTRNCSKGEGWTLSEGKGPKTTTELGGGGLGQESVRGESIG